MTTARSVVDLSGMPPPAHPEVTDIMVCGLLDDLAARRDAEAVEDMAMIRETAGHAYTAELARRVRAVYRDRGEL